MYLVIGLAVVLAVDPSDFSAAVLADAVETVGAGWAVPLVAVGAAVASLGALLGLLAGIGRTSLAMGRERDLPGWLAVVHPAYRVPQQAQLAVGSVVAALVLTTDLRGVIGFSSFGVLLYYALANASAWTQDSAHRRWPRAVNLTGLLGCLVLAVTLPVGAVVTGVGVLALGLIGRAVLPRS